MQLVTDLGRDDLGPTSGVEKGPFPWHTATLVPTETGTDQAVSGGCGLRRMQSWASVQRAKTRTVLGAGLWFSLAKAPALSLTDSKPNPGLLLSPGPVRPSPLGSQNCASHVGS